MHGILEGLDSRDNVARGGSMRSPERRRLFLVSHELQDRYAFSLILHKREVVWLLEGFLIHRLEERVAVFKDVFQRCFQTDVLGDLAELAAVWRIAWKVNTGRPARSSAP